MDDPYKNCTTTSQLQAQWDTEYRARQMRQDNLRSVIQNLKDLRRDTHQYRREAAQRRPDHIADLGKILSEDRQVMLKVVGRYERACARMESRFEIEKTKLEIVLLEKQREYLKTLPKDVLPEIPPLAMLSPVDRDDLWLKLENEYGLPDLLVKVQASRSKHEDLRTVIRSQIKEESEKLESFLDSKFINIRREITKAEDEIRRLEDEFWALRSAFSNRHHVLRKKEQDEWAAHQRELAQIKAQEDRASKEADIARQVYISRTRPPESVIQDLRRKELANRRVELNQTISRLKSSLQKK